MIKELIMVVGVTVGLVAGNTGNPVVVPVEVEEVSPYYVGAGAGVREVRTFQDYLSNDVDEYNDYIGTVLAGYNINKYVGVEGRYTFGEQDYNNVALYGKARFENSTGITPYVGVGYAWEDYGTVEGMSYLGGVSVALPYEGVSLFGDFTYNEEPDDHTFLVGVLYNF